MSYHETYEFFAIDRRLTPAEMRALRRISTRATITPTRFYNFYDWGGLKADPHELVHRYFDLHVYTELSSGARWATLRFPADRIDRRVWRTYVAEQRGTAVTERCASLMSRGQTVLLDLLPPEDPELARSWTSDDDNDEDEQWSSDVFDNTVECEGVDEGSLAVPLALVRADLLAGDLRALYLLWVCSVQGGERRATAVGPPCPPGLDAVSRLSGVLASLADFMRLDEDLLAVALESPRPAGRTAGALLEAARLARAARRRRVAERAAAERARRLARLEERLEDEWTEVARLVEEKKARGYDDALRRLLALHELSVDRRTEKEFAARLDLLLAQHRSRHAFLKRVRSAGLVRERDD
jgi:hypothetical protein